MKTRKQIPVKNRNVFINCPFDSAYVPILQAIVFAVHDAGFIARSALENLDTGRIRLTKILSLIKQCQYGIHDISRVETGTGKLPRFNMPFELGLFIGCQEYGGPNHRHKRTLILDSQPYRFQKTLSDIAGQDAQAHGNEPEKAIALVRSWLRTTSGEVTIPGAQAIVNRYRRFKRDLPSILKVAKISKSEINNLEFFSDYKEFVVTWLKTN